MKKALLFLSLCVFTATGCNCGSTYKFYPADHPEIEAPTDEVERRIRKRNRNKNLMQHIAERTVFIQVDYTPKDGVAVVNTSSPDKYGDGWGSGIIVKSTEKGSYIFTAAHVVEFDDKDNAKHFNCKIDIKRSDEVKSNFSYRAVVVVSNTDRDIAVLHVKENLGVDTSLELDPFTGEDIWAAGFGAQKVSRKTKVISITKGTLATKNLPRRGNSSKNGTMHRVTSQVYFGNSGGGIWTKEGKLVAIVSALLAGPTGVPYEGHYYVKPVGEVLGMLAEKKKYELVFGD